jgi:hypothetical protein
MEEYHIYYANTATTVVKVLVSKDSSMAIRAQLELVFHLRYGV